MNSTESRDSTYLRLARQLRTAILRHEYPEGARLPTEAELAKTHRVSRQTVRRAFHDLVSEGLVYRVPGRGTFATPREQQYLRQFGSIDDLMGLSIDTALQIVIPLHRKVDVDAAARLHQQSDRVHTLSFLRLHDDVPFCLTTVYLPPMVGKLIEPVPELTQVGAGSRATIIGLLDDRLDDPIAEAEQSITVDSARPEIAEHLHCEPGHALLRIDRTYKSTAGQPVELAVSYFLPEHYSYRVHLRRTSAEQRGQNPRSERSPGRMVRRGFHRDVVAQAEVSALLDAADRHSKASHAKIRVMNS